VRRARSTRAQCSWRHLGLPTQQPGTWVASAHAQGSAPGVCRAAHLVYAPARYPACCRMLASMAVVEPLPLVPATWAAGQLVWGSPRSASRRRMRPCSGLARALGAAEAISRGEVVCWRDAACGGDSWGAVSSGSRRRRQASFAPGQSRHLNRCPLPGAPHAARS
jgi:hypothetical protein